jgi:hypothetical protein
MPRIPQLLLPIHARTLRLQELILKVENGDGLPISEMRSAVPPDVLKNLTIQLLRELRSLALGRDIPSTLKKYVELIKKADQLASRPRAKAPATHGPGLKGQKLPFCAVDHAYERAWEYLEEYVSLSEFCWLDRWPNFDDPGNSSGPSLGGIPRLIGSRSQYAQARLRTTEAHRKLKLNVLNACLEDCLYL